MNTPQPSRPGRDGKPTERNQMPVRWLVLVLTCTLMSEWPPLLALAGALCDRARAC